MNNLAIFNDESKQREINETADKGIELDTQMNLLNYWFL